MDRYAYMGTFTGEGSKPWCIYFLMSQTRLTRELRKLENFKNSHLTYVMHVYYTLYTSYTTQCMYTDLVYTTQPLCSYTTQGRGAASATTTVCAAQHDTHARIVDCYRYCKLLGTSCLYLQCCKCCPDIMYHVEVQVFPPFHTIVLA